jgi:hypothetical protein
MADKEASLLYFSNQSDNSAGCEWDATRRAEAGNETKLQML